MLSKIIKYYTGDEFSHVSIALDAQLRKMYSFGRLNPYNPFWGGFVHERIDSGTLKRFSKTKARVYSLEIDDEQKRPKSKNEFKSYYNKREGNRKHENFSSRKRRKRTCTLLEDRSEQEGI